MELIYFVSKGKVRCNNEDGVLIDELCVRASMQKPKKIAGVFSKIVVSDGMGGLESGEVATRVLLEHFSESKIATKEDIGKIVEQSADSFLENSGCAMAGISIDSGLVFNVGDCRVYKKEELFLNRVSKDHSLAQQLIDMGQLSEEDVIDFEKKNVLTSAVMKNKKIEIFIKEIKVKKDDIFLICSDGLWGEFEIDELEECFNSDNIEKIGENLFNALQKKEQKDNISFAIVKV